MQRTTGGAQSGRTVFKGWCVIGEKRMYLKSRWEYLYCHYLELLKTTRQIIEWEYEPQKFWFSGIKSGTTNYTPDFRIIHKDNSEEWVEVKGFMDDKSQTKINRMAKYHPNIRLRVVGKDFFKKNKKILLPLIKQWVI